MEKFYRVILLKDKLGVKENYIECDDAVPCVLGITCVNGRVFQEPQETLIMDADDGVELYCRTDSNHEFLYQFDIKERDYISENCIKEGGYDEAQDCSECKDFEECKRKYNGYVIYDCNEVVTDCKNWFLGYLYRTLLGRIDLAEFDQKTKTIEVEEIETENEYGDLTFWCDIETDEIWERNTSTYFQFPEWIEFEGEDVEDVEEYIQDHIDYDVSINRVIT